MLDFIVYEVLLLFDGLGIDMVIYFGCLFRVLCKYFAHGACLKGEYCEFSHDWTAPPSNVNIPSTLCVAIYYNTNQRLVWHSDNLTGVLFITGLYLLSKGKMCFWQSMQI